MEIQRLRIFSIGNLIGNINKQLPHIEDGGIWIDLENLADLTPRKDVFPHLGERKEVDSRVKYPLMRRVFGGSLLSVVAATETDKRIGYLIAETGTIDGETGYGSSYEALKLKIKRPIERKDNLVIPRCTIKISVEAEDSCPLGEPDRIDHERKYWIDRPADLKKVLPTEWFLRNGVYQPGN
jgi:hypothetical protein